MEINVREQFLDMSWKSGDTIAVLTPHGGGPYTAEELRLLSVSLEKMAEIMEQDQWSREYDEASVGTVEILDRPLTMDEFYRQVAGSVNEEDYEKLHEDLRRFWELNKGTKKALL